MNSTYFGLLAEFETAEIPLEKVCQKYFGLGVEKAKRAALMRQLPVPVYRVASSQKSPWLVSAADLAAHIDEQRDKARKEWAKMNERAAV